MWMQHASRSSEVGGGVELPPLEQVCDCHGEASYRVNKHPTLVRLIQIMGLIGNLCYLSDSPPPVGNVQGVCLGRTYMYILYIYMQVQKTNLIRLILKSIQNKGKRNMMISVALNFIIVTILCVSIQSQHKIKANTQVLVDWNVHYYTPFLFYFISFIKYRNNP